MLASGFTWVPELFQFTTAVRVPRQIPVGSRRRMRLGPFLWTTFQSADASAASLRVPACPDTVHLDRRHRWSVAHPHSVFATSSHLAEPASRLSPRNPWPALCQKSLHCDPPLSRICPDSFLLALEHTSPAAYARIAFAYTFPLTRKGILIRAHSKFFFLDLGPWTPSSGVSFIACGT